MKRHEIEADIDELRRKHTPESLREGFMTRRLDGELERIGDALLGERAVHFPHHIKVWCAYEYAIGSAYSQILF
jgi:hypothetical protein